MILTPSFSPSLSKTRCVRRETRIPVSYTHLDVYKRQREGFSLDGDAASLIARLSDGGMRDALSLLDVCAANTDAVTVETVAAAAGLAGSAHLMELTGRIPVSYTHLSAARRLPMNKTPSRG